MKALLVIESETTYAACKTLLKLTGFDIIRYRHPVKAMDNMEEVSPDIMIIHTGDFPRHWKTLVQFATGSSLLAAAQILLIKTPFFNDEEAAKATELGVSGIIEDPANMSDLAGIKETLQKYAPRLPAPSIEPEMKSQKKECTTPSEPVYMPRSNNPVICLLTNPVSGSIITGTVETISCHSFTFMPDSVVMMSGMTASEAITEATVKLNDQIISPKLSIKPDGESLVCTFCSPTEEEKKVLDSYLKVFEI